jgi:hypothetical protein
MKRIGLIMMFVLLLGLATLNVTAQTNDQYPIKITPMYRAVGYNETSDVSTSLIGMEFHTIWCNDENLSFDDLNCIFDELGLLGYKYLIIWNGTILDLVPPNATREYAVYGNGFGVWPPGTGNRRNMNLLFQPVGVIRDPNGRINELQLLAMARLSVNFTLEHPNASTMIGADAGSGNRMNDVLIKYQNGSTIINNDTINLLPFNPTWQIEDVVSCFNYVGKPYGFQWAVRSGENRYFDPRIGQNMTWDIKYIARVT